MKHFIFLIMMMFGSVAYANDIYITQSGDNLDLDITQDGQDNEFGDSTTDATLTGDTMTFNITQTGDYNKIDVIIDGNNYTGTWVFTGDDNTVDMTCDSASGLNCETVQVDIDVTGDDSDFKIYIGETADADTLVADFTIVGDGNAFYLDADGTNQNFDVNVNSSSTLLTAGTSRTHLTYDVNADSAGNLIAIDSTGDGDVNGHEVDLTVTGGGGDFIIIQSGIYDNLVNATFSGDSANVQITQSD
jgi:hypothetical protein